jgi:KUP system potassium uptake protein
MTNPTNQAPAGIGGFLKPLGLVFGDIGTSPIYTLTVVFLLTSPTESNVIGVLSLIVWTLTILVSVEYAWLAMSLGKKGEGGTIVLRNVLVPLLKSSRKVAFVTVLTFIGVSLLVGDGVITPAISILSAVEGILLIPGFGQTDRTTLLILAAVIATMLFTFQRRGTERVAGAFGPLMLVWFLGLFVSGIVAIVQYPSVCKAINPFYAVKFLGDHGIAGFFVLSEVILCATGGEALYADMGQLGREPIVKTWYFVWAALLVNYLGQGAFSITHGGHGNLIFRMVLHEASFLYVPFLVLSICATVIASQAMISGMFSIVYQGINIKILPLFKVEYTSKERRSQIYIGTVNWFLLIAVIFVLFHFEKSDRLAAAYGLAVTGTMSLTGIMMTWIFSLRRQFLRACVSLFVAFIDIVFLISNAYKIPHGGYWSIIIAGISLTLILIYTSGQKKLGRAVRPMKHEEFVKAYVEGHGSLAKIEGTALYFVHDPKQIPPYITRTMFQNHIIYEDNVIVRISVTNEPFGVKGVFQKKIAEGLRVFEIKIGYMEVMDLDAILRKAGIDERTIFYGLDEVVSSNLVWKLFSVIKRLTPPFAHFYDLPADRIHGVFTRIEM